MSNSPSPPRELPENTSSPSPVSQILDVDPTSRATVSPMPTTAAAIGPSYGTSLYLARDSPHFRHAPTITTASQLSQAPLVYSSTPTQQRLDPRSAHRSLTEEPPIGPSAGPKTARKSKAHVASACINCKRAHLSCDINRPCTRCVSSGKQDSCFDVQHKKRGRPRLREEGSFTVERAVPDQTALSVNEPAIERPIVAPRPRRAESFRSLRSQDSETSNAPASPTYPYPPPPTATAASFGHQYSTQLPGYEIPTAYLDMDLVILKANQSFCQIMSIDPKRHMGISIDKVAVPSDGHSLHMLRADLRLERERRDPSYMPPIVQHEQDASGGAQLADVDHYTQGSEERNYTWTQAQLGQSSDRFPARVRLAKAHAWFVALTLPSFRPGPPPVSPMASSFSARSYHSAAEQADPSQHLASHSAPTTLYAPLTFEAPLPAPLRTPGHHATRSYPPPQSPLTYQQQTQRPSTAQHYLENAVPLGQQSSATASRLTTGPSLVAPAVFTPRPSPREVPPSRDSIPSTGFQLPPILRHSASLAAITSTTRTQANSTPAVYAGFALRPDNTSGDDGDDTKRSPRKRRRIDLTDVLHKD
ncbi:putative zn(2)-C6 fungal-type DNA-binding domain-containing protein [Septoria linicola]|nr:putative zn(2)-C6 fungal-type DNA-binding domain-containing protein [Septoria linicola]